jgi:hypothetical protein
MKNQFITMVLSVLAIFGLSLKAYSSDIQTPKDFILVSGSLTSEISQYGITWKFEKPVQFGQFVTGDYWVVGPVTIDAITPYPKNGQNGSMINPLPKGKQGFDSRAQNYDDALSITLPKVLVPGDSLLSSISLDGTESSEWNGNKIGSNQFLRTVAVLTVLKESPPIGSFRPSYCDRDQTLYNINQIKLDILPSLSAQTLPNHANFDTVAYFERGMERPWILFGRDWQARSIHPTLNMSDYHEEIGMFLSEATLLLTTDLEDKTTLVNSFIQVGIDYYKIGPADTSFWAWPVVMTGLLLNEPSIYNFWINNPQIRTGREHEKLYYPAEVSEKISSSIVPANQTWVNWATKDGKYVAFRKQVGEEYEHLHPSEWQCHSPHCKGEIYRAQHDVYPLIGMTLSSILVDNRTPLDVNAMLAHNPIRDYCDRWMSDGFKTKEYKTTGRTYKEEMEHYTDFTIYHFRQGSGATDFIDEMWKTYR